MATKGHPMSAAAKAKLSAELKGKKHPHKGHTLSAATKAKIAAALRGKHRKGRPMSAAAKAKLSATLRARDQVAARVTSRFKAGRRHTTVVRHAGRRGVRHHSVTYSVHHRHINNRAHRLHRYRSRLRRMTRRMRRH